MANSHIHIAQQTHNNQKVYVALRLGDGVVQPISCSSESGRFHLDSMLQDLLNRSTSLSPISVSNLPSPIYSLRGGHNPYYPVDEHELTMVLNKVRKGLKV